MAFNEQQSIDEAVRRFIDVYNPQNIYLFDESPDTVFIIIVDGSWQQPSKRSIAGKYALWGLTAPKDIFVFTRSEFDESACDLDSFAYRIKHEGKLLYART